MAAHDVGVCCVWPACRRCRVRAVEPQRRVAAALRSSVCLNGFGDRFALLENGANPRLGLALSSAWVAFPWLLFIGPGGFAPADVPVYGALCVSARANV